MRLVEERVTLPTRARGPLCWVCYGKEFVLSDCRQAKNVSVGDAVVDSWPTSLSDAFLGAMLPYLTVALTC